MKSFRCEAELGWIDNPRCENTARIIIDGHFYCHLHASLLAILKFKNYKIPDSGRCECTCKQHFGCATQKDRELREAEGWRCKLIPRYKIDGINMCQPHAKLVALQHLVKDGMADVLPYNGPYKPMCFV